MRKEDEEEDYLDDSKSSSSRDFGNCSVIVTMLCFFVSTLAMKTP